MRAFAETRGFLLGRPSKAEVTPDGKAVLFLRSAAREPTLVLYELEVATGKLLPLVTPAQLLAGASETISVAEAARRERQRIVDKGFTTYQLSRDGRRVLLPLSGKIYVYDREGPSAGKVHVIGGPGRADTGAKVPKDTKVAQAEDAAILDPRLSPDGRRIAFVRHHDLHVADIASGRIQRLTRGGSADVTRGLAEFVAQEEMERHQGTFWSPDGQRLAYAEVDQRHLERFTIADPAHPEKPANEFPYPRAGKANARARLGLIAASGGGTTWIDWDRERYPYLARVVWDAPRAPLGLLVQTRDQREAAFLTVDGRTGRTRVIHVEKDDAWVELDRELPRWLPDGSGFVMASERTGRRALELRAPDGQLVRELVAGDRGFHSLVELSDDARWAVVTTASPTGTRVWRVPVANPAGAQPLTPEEPAEHTPSCARNAPVCVDTRTRIDSLPETVVLRAPVQETPAGMAVADKAADKAGKAGKADKAADGPWSLGPALPSLAAAPPFRARPQLTTVTSPAGRTFHAAIVRPRAFVTGRRYPVIVNVYGGPTALVVRADERHYLLAQWIADHGAIVVAIDNRGTPRRDRAWSRAIKGSFGKIPLDDQVEALTALGARHPELDLARVGIYGWSFGGYMAALAVLRRPDVFKAAVAGAPVVDWLDYDTHYTERYLDLPEVNPKGYQESNLLTLAGKLTRPLLLIHGTGDDNVYFFHSLKLGNAFFRAGRPYDFLPLTVTHQVPDPVVRENLWGRIVGYLLQNLR